MKPPLTLKLHRMQLELLQRVLLLFGQQPCKMDLQGLVCASAALLAVRVGVKMAQPGKEFKFKLKLHEAITLGMCIQTYTTLPQVSRQELLELRQILTPIHQHLS